MIERALDNTVLVGAVYAVVFVVLHSKATPLRKLASTAPTMNVVSKALLQPAFADGGSAHCRLLTLRIDADLVQVVRDAAFTFLSCIVAAFVEVVVMDTLWPIEKNDAGLPHLGWLLLTATFGEAHFYFSHRLLHTPWLYVCLLPGV